MALDASAEAIEREIDEAYRTHPLLRRSYPDAIFHLYAATELKGAADVFGVGKQDRAIGLTATVNALKHAVRWLSLDARKTDAPFELAYDGLKEGVDFLAQAEAYLAIVAAYSFARRGIVNLSADAKTLEMAFTVEHDRRYEAYDLLISPTIEQEGELQIPDAVKLRREIERCFKLGVIMGAIPTTRRVLEAASSLAAPIHESYYVLPQDWRFATFSLADFKNVNNVIRGLLFAWRLTSDAAAAIDPSYRRFLPFVVSRRELAAAVKDVARVDRKAVSRILQMLTYGAEPSIKFPDPVLQPLVPFTSDKFIVNSSLLVGGSPERNLVALVNTLPDEKKAYDALKHEKEAVMRERLERRRPQGLRSWFGRIPGRSDLPDVDYALIEKSSRTILLSELKWFVQPAEPREVVERGEELKKGVTQCQRLLSAYSDDPNLFRFLLPDAAKVGVAVISANSIGQSSVQAASVPIINEEHFARTIESSSLADTIEWLNRRDYLPVEGVHFGAHEQRLIRHFSWTLQWYGFEALVKEDFLPL